MPAWATAAAVVAGDAGTALGVLLEAVERQVVELQSQAAADATGCARRCGRWRMRWMRGLRAGLRPRGAEAGAEAGVGKRSRGLSRDSEAAEGD